MYGVTRVAFAGIVWLVLFDKSNCTMVEPSPAVMFSAFKSTAMMFFGGSFTLPTSATSSATVLLPDGTGR